jgi:hypothetical protein
MSGRSRSPSRFSRAFSGCTASSGHHRSGLYGRNQARIAATATIWRTSWQRPSVVALSKRDTPQRARGGADWSAERDRHRPARTTWITSDRGLITGKSRALALPDIAIAAGTKRALRCAGVEDLSRDSLLAQRIAVSLRVQVDHGGVDGGIQGVYVGPFVRADNIARIRQMLAAYGTGAMCYKSPQGCWRRPSSGRGHGRPTS